ncbi:MAG TPA: carotenoid biosynthesis protein [Patescibacteria group bacterium]|nr:carotenoid biosynthesis protein [Patescibacteria group bacterium]
MNRILWGVFFINILVISLYIFASFLGLNLNISNILKLLFLILPIILLFLHSMYSLGKIRGLVFIVLASLTGLGSEIWALKTGTIFGGHYIYQPSGLMIFNVPLIVIFFWGVFIYTGYCITNSFLYWLNKTKPNRKKNNILFLPLLVLFDGLFVVAIDLFMDPIEVKAGAWHWLGGGAYFGIPIGNFIGWFLVTILVTGIYRLFEYYFFGEQHKIDKKIFLIPVIGYTAICVSLTVSALNLQLLSLAVIGLLLMPPTIIANLFLFNNWNSKIKS